MNLCKRKDISDSLQWKCPACLLTSSIRRSSIFEKSKLPLRKLMELVYYFGIDLQIYEVEKLSDISHVSVIEWFDQFRIVCKESLTNDPVLLGSNSEHLIEIDESLFGKKRKYHRGTGKQDTWVFGMVEKGSRKVILQIVEKRDRKTLLPIIQENVAEGAHINSDCWAAYNTLEKEGFVHKTVNHSKEFKAQDGTCTNEIEGIWGLAKLKIKSMKGVRHERIGQTNTFGLFGIVKLEYSLDKDSPETFSLHLDINVCFEPDDKCELEIEIFNETTANRQHCDQAPGFLNSSFSLNSWLSDKSTDMENIDDATASDLLTDLGLSDYMGWSNKCSIYNPPFNGSIDGWSNDCSNITTPLVQLNQSVVCHITESCDTVTCCAEIPVLKRYVYASVNLRTCDYILDVYLEEQHFEFNLMDYEWGKIENVQIHGVLQLVFAIHHIPSEKLFSLDVKIKACFEENGTVCLYDYTVMEDSNLLYSQCDLDVERAPFKGISFDLWQQTECSSPAASSCSFSLASTSCSATPDCQGITCCLPLTFINGERNINVTFHFISCTLLEYSVERKLWQKTLEKGKVVTENIGDAFQYNYTLATALTPNTYVVTIDIQVCYLAGEFCKTTSLLKAANVKCSSTTRRKKRKRRSITEPSVTNFKDSIRMLIEQQVSSEGIEKYLEEVKNFELGQIQQNLIGAVLPGTDTKTSVKSAMKALGWNNPATIAIATDIDTTVTVTGGEMMTNMLGSTTSDIQGRTKQAYVVGHGLTNEGVKLLGQKLANMTIGDIENLLDVKNVDPVEIIKLMDQLRDLFRALTSEFLGKILGGGSDVFKSEDLVMWGEIPLPRVSKKINYPEDGPHIVPIGGFISLAYRVGIGLYFGIKFRAGLNILEMKGIAEVVPYAGVMAYAEVGLGIGPLFGKLRVEGQIMDMKFPTRAEVTFSKFPLDVGITMNLELTPLKIRVLALVTIEIKFWKLSKTIVLYKTTLWSYSTPTIRAKIIDKRKDEKDQTAPAIDEFIDKPGSGRKKRSSAKCLVRQIPYEDYTEPKFEVSIHAGDDRSGVNLYLDIGTIPGGTDVLNKKELAGPATILSEVIYERFRACRNKVALGYGKDIWGDQVVPWNDVRLDQGNINHVTAESDPLNRQVMEMFTSQRRGKLVGPKVGEDSFQHSPGDCARACADLPPTKCMSFNYNSGNGMCELVEAIEGHHFKLSHSGYFYHYERLGVGKTKQFNFDQIQIEHHKLVYVNFRIINDLGYLSFINTQGVLVDLTPPTTGEIKNASQDYLEHVACLSLIPEEHRPDWVIHCRGMNPNVKNHRLIVDGKGSKAVFNGYDPMTDLQYTRINTYITANWDGFNDRESGLLGYTIYVGMAVCEDLIHPHHDPHKHFFEKSQWTHNAMIYPIPAPYETLPDDKYYVTVRALNEVEYGGPLATTVCHSKPLGVDNSPPHVWEIYDIRYDENTYNLTAKHNSSDPHSGLAFNDICLGRTRRDCIEMRWTRLSFDPNITLVRILTDGVPIWMKIRAVNNVDLRTIGVSDYAIIVDKTPPFAGVVMDGPIYGEDLLYTKYPDKICANWLHFYDPESGIGLYLVSVSSVKQINVTDIANLTEYSRTTHEACVELTPENYLEHGHTYFTTLWAFNGAVNQKNVSAISTGVTVDLSKPVPGQVIDGNKTGFEDILFSGNAAKVEVQWRDFYDPESTIRQYDVQVQVAPNLTENFKTRRDFVTFSNITESVKWLNFHFQHKDRVKLYLRTTNGAINSIVNETDGYIVDLTPPKLVYLGDGLAQHEDLEFQSNTTMLSSNFKFIDEESGLDHFKIQIYQRHQSIRSQIVPAKRNEWIELDGEIIHEFIDSSLDLLQGAVYSIRIGAVNKAGFVAAFETNGVIVDITPPTIIWLHVNTLSDDEEQTVYGYVWQADTEGIKAAWRASDHQSGVISFKIAVGSSPGGTEIRSWTDVGLKTDEYINGLSLEVSNTSTKTPVYYVSLIATCYRSDSRVNGAGLESIVIDGTDNTDQDPVSDIGVDIDYQSDISTLSVQYTGFESHLHGVMDYEWAVGTSPGGQDVTTFSSDGIFHVEEQTIAGDGITSSGYAQVNAQLEPGKTYYSTIRGITNAGNIIESVSDGITVDLLPPMVVLDRLSDNNAIDGDIGPSSSMYKSTADSLSALWHYNDTDSEVTRAWYSVGTYPYAEDISPRTEVNISSTQSSHLEVGSITPDVTGKPNIISIWAEDKAGMIGRTTFGSVIIDTSQPGTGYVSCPEYIGVESPILCSWTGFLDEESPIQKFVITLGSEQGSSDVFETTVTGFLSFYSIKGVNHLLSHGKSYYATVTAVNSVDMETYAFSGPISIDTTPPKHGKVVDLHTIYRINVNDNSQTVAMNAKICSSDEECDMLDAVCSESLTSVSVTWQLFTDDESGIVGYQIAVGTTPGGGQIKAFFDVPQDARYYTVSGLYLMGYRKVYVSVRGTNGAGVSSVATSNGVYISYLSQDLQPLSHVGISDVLENSDVDVDFQESFDTLRASWDLSGDPCPSVRNEWQIQRLDGKVISKWLDLGVSENAMLDGLQLKDRELYYSLLRVTNALNYTYIIRSNGVTVEEDPLLPGKVFDGYITGFDLNILPSKRKISANWEGFGLPASASFQADVEGNPGYQVDESKTAEQPGTQQVLFYEVAVGTDRRFHKTRDNIVPFTKVGLNDSVTFYDLNLESGTAIYYFTVRAYSASFSVATVTSNGFHVGYDGGVEGGSIIMGDYINTDTYVDIQFEGFTSKLDIMMYYVALSNHSGVVGTDCKLYIDGRKSEQVDDYSFNVAPLININKNTFYTLTFLELQPGGTYYVWVIATDESGDCGMIHHKFTVDTTPPLYGALTAGPFYNMDLAYTSDNSTLTVQWTNYSDPESDIATYEVSLWQNTSCYSSGEEVLLVDWIELTNNYTEYSFVNLNLTMNIPYTVRFKVTNAAGLSIQQSSSPVLYDPSKPVSGVLVDGEDFSAEQVWFSSTNIIKGSFLHYPNQVESSCPSRDISMVNDPDWGELQQVGLKDPSGKKWSLLYKKENINKDIYGDIVSVKLARDHKNQQMFTGAYYRSASFENGGTYHVSVKPAKGHGIAVTEILFWDGPDTDIATYEYEEDIDWASTVCQCCLLNPVPGDCNFCNCSKYLFDKYGNATLPTVPSTTVSTTVQTTTQPYEVVNHPDKSEVSQPIDTSIPQAQKSCGIQIFEGQNSKIVTWCRSFNDIQPIMKTSVDYNITGEFLNFKIIFKPEMDDAVDMTLCLLVSINEEEITELCGISHLSKTTKLVLHVFNRDSYVPEITDPFNIFSVKAYFKNLILPPPTGALCRYGDPFRGGTNPIIKYEIGIGTDKFLTDIEPFREVVIPCIPCFGECSRYNCDQDCDQDKLVDYSFTLTDLNLIPYVTDLNETGHSYNKTIIYYLTGRAVTGSGDTALSSSSGFYIDVTGPVFDLDVMLTTPIYFDEKQGQFQPISYQASNNTIKAFWRCTDDESLVKENLWAIGETPGGEELQSFQSVGTMMTGINSSFEGILQHNHTYYVSIICINGGGKPTQWNDSYGVVVLLEPPAVDNLNNTILGEVRQFNQSVVPVDAMESTDPTSIGFTFTISEDKSVKRYDLCIGTDENKDDIFPCTWVGYNVSGSASIKDGYLLLDGNKVTRLSELQTVSSQLAENKTSIFHMEPGRTLFLTMRVCNEAVLCANKSLGSILITNDKTVLKTSEHGESIELVQSIETGSKRRKRDTNMIVVKTPEGLVEGQTIVLQPISDEDLTTEYGSDSSPDFQPYIVNPATTQDMVERVLYKRIHSMVMTFSVIPVGHLPLPGPMNITYPDTVGENEDNRTVLAHWNTYLQQWELTGKTCGETSELEVDDGEGTKTVQICKTWIEKVDGINQTNASVSYFSEETQFAVFIVSNKVYNSPPMLTSDRFISIKEDEGTLQYQLEATDEEGDVVAFYLSSQTNILGKTLLFKDGILLYTPCTDCSGVETLTIILQEIQTNDDIPPASSEATLIITIIDSNDPPEIFLTQYGQSILSSDPTEPVLVYLEQKRIFNKNKWTQDFTAIIGAFDVEKQDLFMEVYQPSYGTVLFLHEKTAIPYINDCEESLNEASEPCGNFSEILPHNKDDMSWIYTTLTYKQAMNVSGYDAVKLYVSDPMNSSSAVVTIQFVMMKSPCHNDGSCHPKNGSNYPCTSTYRAESFDLYYDCVCLPGYSGVYCEENIDECLSSPCLEPYECIDGINMYDCQCPPDEPHCGFKIWTIPVIILSLLIIIIIIIVLVHRYMKKRLQKKEDKADIWSQDSEESTDETMGKVIDDDLESAGLHQINIEENQDESNDWCDPVKALNPEIGRLINPTRRNKVHPAPSSFAMTSFPTAKPNHEDVVEEETKKNSDMNFGLSYDLPVGHITMKPVSRPRMPAFSAPEIVFKLQHEGNTESSDSEQKSTADTESNPESDSSTPERKPFHLQPIPASQKGEMKKENQKRGISAHDMDYSRYNDQKQPKRDNDA
ncbi:Hypothetical predicted protein [Mytilus galloprovincialis]|uniref:Uncharacterized protein n=1 Tax=Mytilus galloprovincialis TaxID=29158 RepID=A0A8B6GQ32_MYTGA|nr:Hypothetical predicted protein [Mytilus galloprovincialis]